MKKIKLNYSSIENIENVLNSELTVYEDIQGAKIYINWDGNDFTITPKNINGTPINIVDLAMQKYYNKAINFFYGLDDRKKSLLPKNWNFCFEYFPDNQPSNIKYDRLPKNNLILTGICKGKRFNYTIDELIEFANLLDVDYLPIIFKGRLNDIQKNAIKYFINTSIKDLEYVFGEKNFAYFFYKLLNPLYENSFLMDTDFQENLDKIIIKTSDMEDTFQIINPLYKRLSVNSDTNYAEIYSILILIFLDFCQLIDLDKVNLKGERKEIIYINLISSLFNMYYKECSDDLEGFQIVIPEFFKTDKFKINQELIENKLTKKYISNPKTEYFFKIILGSFNKKFKKEIGIISENSLILLNKFQKELDDKVNSYMNILTDKEIRKNGLVNFGKYMDFKYDVDGDNQVYPNLYDEFDVVSKDSKDKKKKK